MNVKAFTNSLNGGEKRIAWREEDIPHLAKMYGVPVQKAMEIWQQKKVATSTTRTVAKAAVQEDMPTRWQFTGVFRLGGRFSDWVSTRH
jgi:hypothetical protein